MKTANLEVANSPPLSESLPNIRRIVHATDLTSASSKATRFAIQLARQNHAELILLHVLPPATPIYEIESPLRPEAESALTNLLKGVAALGVKGKRVLVKNSARVSGSIADCARFFGADLIVMGTHGRAGIASWFVGSVASRVIAKAHCPVLVVRGKSASAVSSQRT